MEIFVLSLLAIHAIKVALNYAIWNMKNPNEPAKVAPSGFAFGDSKKDREHNESQFMFVYLAFVLFWISFPKKKRGKVYAYLVLLLTIVQVLSFFCLFYFKDDLTNVH
jgi:hypothetical protein